LPPELDPELPPELVAPELPPELPVAVPELPLAVPLLLPPPELVLLPIDPFPFELLLLEQAAKTPRAIALKEPVTRMTRV
jgi:hypothetical protein